MNRSGSLAKIEQKVDAMQVRERVLLFVCLLAALYFIWETLFLNEISTAKNKIIKDLEMKEAGLEVLQKSLAKNAGKDQFSGNLALSKELEKLMNKKSDLDSGMSSLKHNIISPQEMASVLEDILSSNKEVELVSIENVSFEEISKVNKGEASSGDHQKLFKHGIMLEFIATYGNTYRFLQELEILPWSFIWHSLDYTVETFPQARVKVLFHTLSLQEDWIQI